VILSDRTIRELVSADEVLVVPSPEDHQFQPVSLDLLLGTDFTYPDERNKRENTHLPVTLYPGRFVLGTTRERVRLPAHIAGFVCGKSTWARRGLVVESAGLVDPGFNGTLTLELTNVSETHVTIFPGEAICQIYFMPTDLAVSRPYGSAGLNSHYQDQQKAEPAR
jgi:dCTP deaminase